MSVVGAAVRILGAALDAAIDAALPAPHVQEAHRMADLLAEAEACEEVTEPQGPAECLGINERGGYWKMSSNTGPRPPIWAWRDGQWQCSVDGVRWVYHPVTTTVWASEGAHWVRVDDPFESSPVVGDSQEAAACEGGAVGAVDSCSGDGTDRPNSELYRALASTILRLQKRGPVTDDEFKRELNPLIGRAYERARMFDDIENQ